ncbi:hypothetical protein AAFF_G00360540 [Aldrovandia affinis]|uniref:Uncharacterized protein n=1 Tax=Aldrovandia affinis TaxID=143900 RepID=A0AAD7WNF7_9TELE|nr:hypothetical protein AAFF_G00360540 [Aldrovandia affinis]
MCSAGTCRRHASSEETPPTGTQGLAASLTPEAVLKKKKPHRGGAAMSDQRGEAAATAALLTCGGTLHGGIACLRGPWPMQSCHAPVISQCPRLCFYKTYSSHAT